MVLKPQPTIKGYNAWVLQRLMEAKGMSLAEVTAWVVDHWVDDSGALLEKRYGISRQDFRRSDNVVAMPRRDEA